jgi:hypothetical protein
MSGIRGSYTRKQMFVQKVCVVVEKVLVTQRYLGGADKGTDRLYYRQRSFANDDGV